MEPEELRGEQRWSSIPQHSGTRAYWTQQLDDKLLVLVTTATASGDRFPVGVNWLDVSRAIGHAPVECVKRYAYLHELNQRRPENPGGAMPLATPGGHLTLQPRHSSSQIRNTSATVAVADAAERSEQEDAHAPFSGLSSNEDLASPHARAFHEYGSPLASPRIGSLGNSGEFGLASPGSPPPFAVRTAGRLTTNVSSPFRWENVANETYNSPTLKPPPHVLRRGQQQAPSPQLQTSFGVFPSEGEQGSSAHHDAQSPRVIHGTQHHSRFTDPQFAADLINHAFKGMRFDDVEPPPSPPRMARVISNSEFPFLSDEPKSQPSSSAPGTGETASPLVHRTLQQARHHSAMGMSPSLMASPRSPFSGESPFAGSLTQSALEEAFLDLAGSRLDASSILLASRHSAAPSQPPPPPPAPGQQQNWKPSPSQQRQPWHQK